MSKSSSSLSRTASPNAQSSSAAASAPSTSRASTSQVPASIDEAIRRLAGVEARRRVAHAGNELECRQILATIEKYQQRIRARIASSAADAPLLPNPAPDRMAPTLPVLQDTVNALPHTVEELTAAQLRRVFQFIIKSGMPDAPAQQEEQHAALLTPEQQRQVAQVVFHTRQLTAVLENANNVFLNAQTLLLRKDKTSVRYVALMGYIHVVQHVSTGIAVHRDLIMESLLPPLFARSQPFLDALAALRCTEEVVMEKTMAASAAIAHATRLTRTLEALQMNCVMTRQGLGLTKEDKEYRRLVAPADPGPPPLEPRTYIQALRIWQDSHEEILHSFLTHEFLDIVEREGPTVHQEEQSQGHPGVQQLPIETIFTAAQDISAISFEAKSCEREGSESEAHSPRLPSESLDEEIAESQQMISSRQASSPEEEQLPTSSLKPEQRLEHILDVALEAGQEPNQPDAPVAQQVVRFGGRHIRTMHPFPQITFIWKYEDPTKAQFAEGVQNLYLSEWLPQNDLLADNRLTLFITHGGARSLLESATYGKPLILIPFFGDQTRNAKLAVKFGFGIHLNKASLFDSNALRQAIERILNDEKYTKAAHRMRDLLRKRPFTPEQKLVKTIELAAEFGQIPELFIAGRNLNVFVYYNLDILIVVIILCAVVVFLLLHCLRKLVRRLSSAPADKIKMH